MLSCLHKQKERLSHTRDHRNDSSSRLPLVMHVLPAPAAVDGPALSFMRENRVKLFSITVQKKESHYNRHEIVTGSNSHGLMGKGLEPGSSSWKPKKKLIKIASICHERSAG